MLKNQSKLILNQSKLILNQNPKIPEQENSSEFVFISHYKINLFVCWYNEINPDRMVEYETCLKNNIDNNFINKIYVICEKHYPDKRFHFNSKIEFLYIENRPTYLDIFRIVSGVTGEFDINIISNTDIYFDDSLKYMEISLKKETVFCLTRWNVDKDGHSNFHNRKDSQDVWAFRGKIKESLNANFHMGIAGCDNKIAYELDKVGYKLSNPSLTIKSLHLHNTDVRNYKNGNIVQRVSPPYKLINPTQITNIPKLKSGKSILHLAINLSFQKSLETALMSLGENYHVIDWRKELGDSKDIKSLQHKILEAISEYQPDFIFMQIQTPDIITKGLINEINKIVPNVFILNWNGDIRQDVPVWMVELGYCKNVSTAFTNYKDIGEFEKLGLPVYFMPIGFEESVFNSSKHEFSKTRKKPKLVFTGNNYGDKFPLTQVRLEMISLLKNMYNDSFWIQGNGWGSHSNRSMSKFLSSHLYKNSKICLSVNNINAFRYTSDRLYNIMACNGMALVHYCEGLDIDFKDKEHVVYWKNYKELIDLIQYYLHNNEDRVRIANNGFSEVWSKHRWINRIQNFKNNVLKW